MAITPECYEKPSSWPWQHPGGESPTYYSIHHQDKIWNTRERLSVKNVKQGVINLRYTPILYRRFSSQTLYLL